MSVIVPVTPVIPVERPFVPTTALYLPSLSTYVDTLAALIDVNTAGLANAVARIYSPIIDETGRIIYVGDGEVLLSV